MATVLDKGKKLFYIFFTMEDSQAKEQLINELRDVILNTLELEDISPEEIGDETPLFTEEGLGLDSIDAMELAVALKRRYKLSISEETKDMDKHFSCLAALADFVLSQTN